MQHIRRISDNVLKRFYTPEERLWIDAGEASERSVRLWTMKEAYGKLLGTGIYGGPRFFAEFEHDRLITRYENTEFLFPEAPEELLFTLCIDISEKYDASIPPL